MIARKRMCPICCKEYLAKMDDAWQDFAPHCTIDLPEMGHYVKTARLFNGEDAETFRMSMEEFVSSMSKMLLNLSALENSEVDHIMNLYGLRL